MAFELITPPESEPVTLERAKTALRVDHDHENDLIEGWIAAARELLEEQISRQLVPAGWKLYLDRFPCGAIELRKPPVTEVDSVRYVDPDGEEQTLDAEQYVLDLVSVPPRIAPAFGTSWPVTQCRPNAVSVTFTAGYATVPKRAEQAILLLVGHWHENREAVGTVGKEIELAWGALVESLQWTRLPDLGDAQ